MHPAERIADWTTRRRLLTIAVLLALTVAIGYGALGIDQQTDLGQFETDSTEADKLEYINEHFGAADQDGTTTVQVIVRGDNVLSKQSLLSTIELQQAFRDDPTIDETLVDEPAGDVASAVATAIVRQQMAAEAEELPPERRQQAIEEAQRYEPTLEEQRQALEGASEERVATVVQELFASEQGRALLGLMPTDFDPDATTSDARVVAFTQDAADSAVQGDAPDDIVDSQLRMTELVDEHLGDDGFVFGQGIITDEINRSLEDSLNLVVPFAVLLVLVTLLIAYRDLLDILLGMLGIAVVLVWTFGFMGWADIQFNQIFIAVPVLLIGLSIDYAIHVFMRQREQREVAPGRTSGQSMRIALAGLLVALAWVTATAVFGFLSNVISPVPPIQQFGIVSAVGITSALVIFGLLVPAIKVSVDERLERLGLDRRKRAFGTGGGVVSKALSVGDVLAKRAPWLVILLALLITSGGVYGATQIDTTFEVEDFIAEEPPEWAQELPAMVRPGEYTVKENLDLLSDRFRRDDLQSDVLLEGDVASAEALSRIQSATERAADKPVTVVLGDGRAAVQSPLTVMEAVASRNDDFAQQFAASDTDDDGVPEEDVTALYDALFEAAPAEASNVLYRDDGEYRAARLVVSLRGEAETGAITEDMRDVAGSIDGDGFEATATGQTVVFAIIEEELFQTVFESLLVSLASVFIFLMVVYRLTDGSATLGLVTLFPILLAVAWILGTMYLIEMPFNVVTGTITSLTIGLGVAYNIHMSERFRLELDRGLDAAEAMTRSVTGTGGALLGSAATTVGGFGVLAVAIIPILQQFGVITAITIVYSFLGSVLVLPSLLMLWWRYLGSR
ncbi:MAG: efflux RND transporter permease subunit [Halobacteriales archaeon]